MNFEEALMYELETITGLTDRVFPLTATEGTEPPFLVYGSSNGKKIQALGGFTELRELTAEIHLVTADYAELKSLQTAVIDKLTTFQGRSIGIDGPFIKSFTYDEPEEAHDGELGYERASFDIRVRF
jgi:hypothetical protein